MMIRVQYSCAGCAQSRIEVEVPARGDENLAAWMRQTMTEIGRHHARQSPGCPSTVADVYVPMEPDHKVGSPPTH